MPKLFVYKEYVFYFWSGEDGEPVHVHVCVKRPTENATKIWLTRKGGSLLANNNSQIPKKDLVDILELMALNHERICRLWSERFQGDLSFYE